MNFSKTNNVILFLMIVAIIISAINVICYIFNYNNIRFLITSVISLFIVGVSIISIVLKNNNDKNIYDKYVVLTKEEYKNLKNTLYKQEKELKRLQSTKQL